VNRHVERSALSQEVNCTLNIFINLATYDKQTQTIKIQTTRWCFLNNSKGKGKDVDLYSASTCLRDSSNAHFVTETEPPGRI